MRIGVGSFFHGAGPILDSEQVLSCLRPADIKLIDRVEIFCSLFVEFGWERMKELFDGFGLHARRERDPLDDASRAL